MYRETIIYDQFGVYSVSAYAMHQVHMHAHEDGIEILLVMKGSAKITVAFENFVLNEGDYLVVDRKDAHCLTSVNGSAEIASIHIKMEPYRELFPFIDYVWFTCESFDLVEYAQQTGQLRNMVLGILSDTLDGSENALKKAKRATDRLVETLIVNYDIRNYYCRGKAVGKNKMEKYYKLMGYIANHYERQDLQDFIVEREHYSKSYMTHLFKEVGGISFQDILTYERISRAQELLLTSGETITQIAFRCGFTYMKYFNRDFQKWFACTPSQYRKKYLPKVSELDDCIELTCAQLKSRALELEAAERVKREAHYRVSVNPFSTKQFSQGKKSLDFEVFGQAGELDQAVYGEHLMLRLKSADSKERIEQLRRISSFESAGFHCVIGLCYDDLQMTGCLETFSEILEVLGTERAGKIPVRIILFDLAVQRSASSLAQKGRQILQNEDIASMLML